MKTIATILLLILSVAVWSQETVTIGSQVWAKYNLNTAGGKCYNNDPANCEVYGKLYTWDELMVTSEGDQGICPEGFHVPTRSEWQALNLYLGATAAVNSGTTGKQLREAGFAHWYSPFASIAKYYSAAQLAQFNANFTGTDTQLFTAVGSGYGYGNAFYMLTKTTYYWTSTTDDRNSGWAWYRSIGYANAYLGELSAYKTAANPVRYSVRCIHD